jgi:Flp pilus assembly pilin Flp
MNHRSAMGKDRSLVFRVCKDQRGAGAIEYGLIACVVALVVVYAAARGVSPRLVYQWTALATSFSSEGSDSETSTLP